MNPLMPFLILLLLPLAVIGAVLFTDQGIESALIYSSIKVGLVLFVLGGALSFVASRLSERSEG